jgi:hypothetical protein
LLKRKVSSWQLAVGSWQLAVGSWQLAVGSKQPLLRSAGLLFGSIRGNKKASQRLTYRSYRLTGKNLTGKKGMMGNNTRFEVIMGATKSHEKSRKIQGHGSHGSTRIVFANG